MIKWQNGMTTLEKIEELESTLLDLKKEVTINEKTYPYLGVGTLGTVVWFKYEGVGIVVYISKNAPFYKIGSTGYSWDETQFTPYKEKDNERS